jgi:hypothetical protein
VHPTGGEMLAVVAYVLALSVYLAKCSARLLAHQAKNAMPKITNSIIALLMENSARWERTSNEIR